MEVIIKHIPTDRNQLDFVVSQVHKDFVREVSEPAETDFINAFGYPGNEMEGMLPLVEVSR
jgi:hypothetical protein